MKKMEEMNKEEEREAKGGTSERREEEAGALSPCLSPDS